MNIAPRKKERVIRAGKAFALVITAVIIIFGDFITPYPYEKQIREQPYAPASTIRFIDPQGIFHLRPFVYQRQLVDRLNFGYEELTDVLYPITVFAQDGSGSIRLFGTSSETVRVNLLGTDALGRDRYSRLVIALRFSLVVCIIGTLLAALIGTVFGMLSGYAGRIGDAVMMGIADSVLALPTLIIILAARAAFPLELPPVRAAILLILIFALTGWAEMARLARALVRRSREQEYVKAAKAGGSS